MASTLGVLEQTALSFYADGSTKTDITARIQTANDEISFFGTSGAQNGVAVSNALSYQMVGATSGNFTMEPSAVTTDYKITWPAAAATASGYVLKSDTSGNLTWEPESSDLSWKEPVIVATTTNIALTGTFAIDGVTVAAGDRVLVKEQTTATENGIYIVDAGAWTRAPDMAAASDSSGDAVISTQGTVNADKAWVQTSDPGIVGTDNLVFATFGSAPPAAGTASEIQINDPDNVGSFAACSTLIDPLTSNPSQTTFTYALSADGTVGTLGVGMTPTATNAGAFLILGNNAAAGSALVGTSIGISGGDGDGIASGGIVEIFGGNASAGTGGTIELVLGQSESNNGGDFIVTGGNGGTAGTGNGGNMNLVTGNGGTAGGNAGNVSITTGTPASPGTGNSGDISIGTGSTGTSTGVSGTINLLTGNGSAGGTGDITLETGGVSSILPSGDITLTSGDAAGGNAGGISLSSGKTLGAGNGGNIEITCGETDSTGLGGNLLIASGSTTAGGGAGILLVSAGEAASGSSGDAGSALITGGNSIAGATGNAGNLTLSAGSAFVAGDGGSINLSAGVGVSAFGDFNLRAGTNVATDDGFKFQNSSSVDLILIRGGSENATTVVPGVGQGTLHVTGGASFTETAYATDFNAVNSMIMDGSTSGKFTMQAAAVTTNYTVTWPDAVAAGTGYVLKSDATGALTWEQESSALTWKDSVVAASTANVTIATPGATIDGVTLTANDRVLLKDQTAPIENGIYIWTGPAAALTRSLDMPAGSNAAGVAVISTQGTQNDDTAWVCTTNAPVDIVGTNPLTFVSFGAAGVGAAGIASEIQINDPNSVGSFAASSTINNGGTPSECIFNYAIDGTGTQSTLQVGNDTTTTNNCQFQIAGSNANAASNADGTSIAITGGIGDGTGAGGSFTVFTGQTTSTGDSGSIVLQTGGSTGTGGGGDVFVRTSGSAGGGDAGNITIQSAGTDVGAGSGGSILIDTRPTDGTASGDAGDIVISSGTTTATSTGNAGNVDISAGGSVTAGNAGSVSLTAGAVTGGGTGTFGNITLQTGTSTATDNGFIFQNSSSTSLVLIRGDAENATGITPGAGQGTLHVTGGASFTQDVYGNSFNAISDVRMKTDINRIEDPLNKLMEIEGYSYNWKNEKLNRGKKQLGVIAQQLEEIGLSDVVTGTDDAKAVNYLALIPLMIEAIKEIANDIYTE